MLAMRHKDSWTVLDGTDVLQCENDFWSAATGRWRRGANGQIATSRSPTRERGGGGESDTPIDLQSVEDAAGPPSRRWRPVSLRASAPRGVVLTRCAGHRRDDSGGAYLVLSVPHQGAREQPRVRAVRRSRGRRGEPVRLWRDAIRMVCVHRLGPKSLFDERLVRYLRD